MKHRYVVGHYALIKPTKLYIKWHKVLELNPILLVRIKQLFLFLLLKNSDMKKGCFRIPYVTFNALRLSFLLTCRAKFDVFDLKQIGDR